MSRILVVDDEQAVCWALERALSSEGHKVSIAASAEDAFEVVKKHRPDAVVLDVRLPGIDGLTAMGRLREMTDDAPVIVATAFGNLQTAVKAVEGGAFDYLAKPFDLDQALETVERALQQQKLPESAPEQPDQSAGPPEEIVGTSAAMQTVFKRIALVAPRDSCVLITGESGTGKELVARAVHRYSQRRDRPFLPIHVAALSSGLVESELFGHVKGAFTGATQARSGLLALAEGGTVFFDELAEIPMAVQVKLLRVLEHNEVTPVGGSESHRLNIRVLAATHQDLERRAAEGLFRHDLFYRLNVFQIHLPPLRSRKEDVLPLAEHFLRSLDPKHLPLLPETKEYLESQVWQGNVREMRNAIEHAVIVGRDAPLLPHHFPTASELVGPKPSDQLMSAVVQWLGAKIQGGQMPTDLYQELLQIVEPALLEEVMRRVRGNRWLAAQWLGLNRATVRKKLGAYGLTDAYREGKIVPGDD